MTGYLRLSWILCIPFLVIVVEPAQEDETDTKLLLVQILFRHGARAPNALYPRDPYPPDVWPEGLGKLTLHGKKQTYALGQLFRKMYGDFITTDPNEVTVNSSNSDRCLRSALCNIAAFYKPSPKWSFDDHVDWQPIPVYSVPESEDKYLSPQIPCPRPDIETFNDFLDGTKHLLANHEEMVNNLTQIIGQPMDKLMTLFGLHDTLMIERYHNLSIPPWAEHYYDELAVAVEPLFSLIGNPAALRLRIGPLLGRIVEDMVKKSAGVIPDIKVRLYSSHDYEVALMLKALKVFNEKRPPFCASVVFELRERKNGEKMVRLFYLNSTTPEDVSQVPHPLILEGCSEYCPLDYFVKYTKDNIPEDWEKECRVEDFEFTDPFNFAPLSDVPDACLTKDSEDI